MCSCDPCVNGSFLVCEETKGRCLKVSIACCSGSLLVSADAHQLSQAAGATSQDTPLPGALE